MAAFSITPVVEALPDHAMVRKIVRDFTRLKVCPMSELFAHAAILWFYGGAVIPVPQHLYRKKRRERWTP